MPDMTPTKEQIATLIGQGLMDGKNVVQIASDILALTSEPEESWPTGNERYFYLDDCIDVGFSRWTYHRSDLNRKKTGNVFRTKAEAIARRGSILSGDLIVKYVKRGE